MVFIQTKVNIIMHITLKGYIHLFHLFHYSKHKTVDTSDLAAERVSGTNLVRSSKTKNYE